MEMRLEKSMSVWKCTDYAMYLMSSKASIPVSSVFCFKLHNINITSLLLRPEYRTPH